MEDASFRLADHLSGHGFANPTEVRNFANAAGEASAAVFHVKHPGIARAAPFIESAPRSLNEDPFHVKHPHAATHSSAPGRLTIPIEAAYSRRPDPSSLRVRPARHPHRKLPRLGRVVAGRPITPPRGPDRSSTGARDSAPQAGPSSASRTEEAAMHGRLARSPTHKGLSSTVQGRP
jgi:hypothetical protein